MEWQPTPVFLPGESPWTEEPGGATVHGVAKSRTGPRHLARTQGSRYDAELSLLGAQIPPAVAKAKSHKPGEVAKPALFPTEKNKTKQTKTDIFPMGEGYILSSHF